MAKIGEGDPRWLVQQREDGKNVGNWHWSEKSLFPWAKEQLENTFASSIIFEDNEVKIWFDGVDSFKGDMFVNNRKGKTLFIWDVNLTINWKGETKVEGNEEKHEASGKVECTDMTVTDDDFEVKFVINSGDDAKGREMLAKVKQLGKDLVKKGFGAMTSLMSSSFQDSNKADSSTDGGSSSGNGAGKNLNFSNLSQSKTSSSSSVVSSTTTTSSGVSVKTFQQIVRFRVAATALYDTLLDSQRVSAFTGSPCKISSEKGSSFQMFGGTVLGTMEEAVAAQKIVQKWRFASWPAEHYSQVNLEITDKGSDKCILKLTHTGIPESDFDRTRFGWEEFFWRRIKGVFGWDYKIKQ